ncbi:SDR family oxidoreductase [Streptomyces sp. SID486]|uniref:SDR family oxidoreductase n=1 Tax=Streptomyces sp. SID486 TaxID=2690264 RepID=UPI001371789A|nr:SDR family oxidoreductase [Streptomyces sp. SID486]MYX97527.1 SDR family oxidoreductase [Streptomyces sp. SID486]
MGSRPSPSRGPRDPALVGQTLVVIGGSAGIGLATARLARAEGASVVLTGRDPERLRTAATEVEAISASAFDAGDPARLRRFFEELPVPVDHVLVTAGRPSYGRLLDMDAEQAREAMSGHVTLALEVARHVAGRVRPGGTLLLLGGTGARRVRAGLGTAPAVTAGLALELAPVRVNLIAAGFVDTPLSARLLGDGLDARREELRATLPIGRVVVADDVAALAVHLMTNTALTGATYDIDGGQQFVG